MYGLLVRLYADIAPITTPNKVAPTVMIILFRRYMKKFEYVITRSYHFKVGIWGTNTGGRIKSSSEGFNEENNICKKGNNAIINSNDKIE